MRTHLLTGLAVLLASLLSARAAADVPGKITFTARIQDATGPLTGAHALVFELYDVETGGGALWSETHASVTVDDGRVTVSLGPLNPSLLAGDDRWIEVILDGQRMAPRLPLRSVPFALRSGDADKLGGQSVAAFAPAAHQHDAFTGALDLGGDLRLGGKSALRGNDTWLRLNQDGAFVSGIHSPLNANFSGLTVGPLYHDPGTGNLDVNGFSWLRGGGRLNGIAVGSAPFGALPYPYETIQVDPAYQLRFAFGPTERMRLGSDGRLWMASTHGDCVAGWYCNGMFWDISAASILYSGLAQRSDARLKKDIEPIAHGLDTVRALRPVTFAWRDPAVAGRHHGFIAQEVQRVVPDLVSQTPDGTLALDTQELLPILMRAVQELDAQNAELRARLDDDRPRGAPSSLATVGAVLALAFAGLIVLRVRSAR